jgi:hypothetical protein
VTNTPDRRSKRCGICGEIVDDGSLECPRCGQGIFETFKASTKVEKVEAKAINVAKSSNERKIETPNNCFYHRDLEAIAKCAGCGLSLCEKCLTRFGRKYYCQRCADTANGLVDYKKHIMKHAKRMMTRMILYFLSDLIIIPLIGRFDNFSEGQTILIWALFYIYLIGVPVLLIVRFSKKIKPDKEKIKQHSVGIQQLADKFFRQKGLKPQEEPKEGSVMTIFLGAIVGFIAMMFLDFIPILGPILAGFIAGLIAGHGAGRGLTAGFLAGILGSVIVAVLIGGGIGFFGNLVHLPVLGSLLGGAIGLVIIILGLYNAFLGLIGGAIGGALRGR